MLSKYLLITMNSPDNTRRTYKLEVRGLKDSVFPMICAVDAVGIHAISNEFLAPYCITSRRKDSQSLDDGIPHKSN